MVRHFKTRKEAETFKAKKSKGALDGLRVFRKKKGMKNKREKPFVVCTVFEWLNLN